MKINKVSVILQPNGMDQIVLHVSLTTGPSDFVTWKERDKGEDFSRQNFPGVPLNVVNRRDPNVSVSKH